jgi:hypothetical protein
MQAEATPLPCPGKPSPVRPVAVVPVCQACPLWLRFAELDAHQRPVAYHDGTRWVCERRPLPAADETVVSEEIRTERPPPLGPGVATRRGDFFP